MKERPILFRAPMVRALLAGTKTQTRRIVKPQPAPYESWDWSWPVRRKGVTPGTRICWRDDQRVTLYPYCPYGVPGDRLWVQETCRAHELTDKEAESDTFGIIERKGLEYPLYGLDGVIYKADGVFREIECTREAADLWMDLNAYRGKRGATVPPIHMPRWASRITLEITDVRVERLQDISEADAIAEGIDPPRCPHCGYTWGDCRQHMDHRLCVGREPESAVAAYRALWGQINGPDSWASNPWVWVVCFRRLDVIGGGK